MTSLIANLVVLGGGQLTRTEVELFSLIMGAALLVGICWQTVDTLTKRFYGRNWPTVMAVIDTVSVTVLDGIRLSSAAVHEWPSYLATLTYSYRNPGQQIGEYKRRFGKEDDAKAWVNSYKGETVKVHVDPRDPTRSVLREEDL